MRGGDSIFECAHLLYYKLYKVNKNPGGLYKDFPQLNKK